MRPIPADQKSRPGPQFSKRLLSAVASCLVVLGCLGTPRGQAQSFHEIKPLQSPLILSGTGSFYVGGRQVTMSATETGLYGAGPLVVDQMYVQYLDPAKRVGPPVVMIHGATLSGKSFETTPDGRIGWYEYFAAKGYPSYVVDQVGRARSGFDQAPFNDARAGVTSPQSQPNLRRVAADIAWVRSRIGPSAGNKFDDTQFPTEAADELAKQSVPDLSASSTPPDPSFTATNDPNFSGLAELANALRGAVLIGHSQAGRYPFEAALLDPTGIKALVAVEPGGCNANVYTDLQIAKLARLPILVVFGDHLEVSQPVGANWYPFYKDCEVFVARVNAAHGRAKMLHPPDLGIHGNTHMIMQDKNNLQIADLIMKWIATSVP